MKTLRIIVFSLLVTGILQSCIVSERPNMDFFSDSGYNFKDAKFTSFNVPLLLAKPYIKKALEKTEKVKNSSALLKRFPK
jgi:hypothetical protein